MDANLLERALSAAEEAEVYVVTTDETPVSFEANRLKTIERKQTEGVALRLIAKGKLGFSSTTRQGEEETLVARALALAELGPPANFHLPSQQPARQPQVYDQAIVDLSVNDLVEVGERLISEVRQFAPDMLWDVDVRKHIIKTRLANSNGGAAIAEKTVFSAAIHGNRVRDTDLLDIWESESSCRALPDPLVVARRLIEKLEWASTTVTTTTQRAPVVFTPKGVAATFLEPLLAAFNGKLVWQRASPLAGRLGEPVFDARLSLRDDGTLDDALESAAYDDEGVPIHPLPLIEHGVVRNFFYDLQSAGLADVASTGHGFRSLHSLPAPSPTSLILDEGDADWEAMIREIPEGILVDQTMGSWAGNQLAGDFSANVHLGFKVEQGKIVGRVKDTMVAGNIYQALHDELLAVGRAAQWGGGRIKVPSLAFKALAISTRGS
ncbi:MAG: TldD/PmbA family protein [Chloroflexi bacterium]|nr:TldD/PmbA family protein [Chloroflexota bacterium]